MASRYVAATMMMRREIPRLTLRLITMEFEGPEEVEGDGFTDAAAGERPAEGFEGGVGVALADAMTEEVVVDGCYVAVGVWVAVTGVVVGAPVAVESAGWVAVTGVVVGAPVAVESAGASITLKGALSNTTTLRTVSASAKKNGCGSSRRL
jgi:hypothetical protein